jgi:hypothetical protein
LKEKSPEPGRLTVEVYQMFKEKLIPTLLILFQETKRERTLQNSFYEASITLIPNWTRTKQKSKIIGKSH